MADQEVYKDDNEVLVGDVSNSLNATADEDIVATTMVAVDEFEDGDAANAGETKIGTLETPSETTTLAPLKHETNKDVGTASHHNQGCIKTTEKVDPKLSTANSVIADTAVNNLIGTSNANQDVTVQEEKTRMRNIVHTTADITASVSASPSNTALDDQYAVESGQGELVSARAQGPRASSPGAVVFDRRRIAQHVGAVWVDRERRQYLHQPPHEQLESSSHFFQPEAEEASADNIPNESTTAVTIDVVTPEQLEEEYRQRIAGNVIHVDAATIRGSNRAGGISANTAACSEYTEVNDTRRSLKATVAIFILSAALAIALVTFFSIERSNRGQNDFSLHFHQNHRLYRKSHNRPCHQSTVHYGLNKSNC